MSREMRKDQVLDLLVKIESKRLELTSEEFIKYLDSLRSDAYRSFIDSCKIPG